MLVIRNREGVRFEYRQGHRPNRGCSRFSSVLLGKFCDEISNNVSDSSFHVLYVSVSINLLKPKTLRTTSFNIKKFCVLPMCFAWISEQTAIISVYSINLSLFITEAESVYCAVRTGPLNLIDPDSSLKG